MTENLLTGTKHQQGYCWPNTMIDWPYKNRNIDSGPFPIQIRTCKFNNFDGPFEILTGHLENMMGRRILYIYASQSETDDIFE